MNLVPGDAFGLICPNPDNLVNPLLERLQLSGESTVQLKPREEKYTECIPKHIESPCKIRTIFKNDIDCTSPPSKALLMMLSRYTSSPEESAHLQYLASSKGRQEYGKEMEEKRPTLLTLLNSFPSCQPPLDHLLDCLPPLQPRYYSAANGRLEEEGKRLEFAFTVVEEEKNGKKFQGLCSRLYLREMSACKNREGKERMEQVKVFPRKTEGRFALPESMKIPIIMIAAGTGIAPFRGFLQRRRSLRSFFSSSSFLKHTILFFQRERRRIGGGLVIFWMQK